MHVHTSAEPQIRIEQEKYLSGIRIIGRNRFQIEDSAFQIIKLALHLRKLQEKNFYKKTQIERFHYFY